MAAGSAERDHARRVLQRSRALPARLWAMRGVCAPRPSCSFFVGGLQLPLKARTFGIYAGLLLTVLLLAASGRWRAIRLGSRDALAARSAVRAHGRRRPHHDAGRSRHTPLYRPTTLLRPSTSLSAGLRSGILVARPESAAPRALPAGYDRDAAGTGHGRGHERRAGWSTPRWRRGGQRHWRGAARHPRAERAGTP